MRDAYHEELDSIGDGLVEMARLVGSAIGRATTSILDSDLKLAESVIEADVPRRFIERLTSPSLSEDAADAN